MHNMPITEFTSQYTIVIVHFLNEMLSVARLYSTIKENHTRPVRAERNKSNR